MPDAGETQYVVINPTQIEKLEEAVNRLTAVIENKRVYQSISFPDEFWRKFYAGCFLASSNFSLDSAVNAAADLVKQFKQESQ